MGLAGLVALGIGVIGVGPVGAATPTLTASITTSTPTVPAGAPVMWTVNWSCSSAATPCTGAMFTVPIPVSTPDSIVLANCSATGDPLYITSATITAAGVATWTFVASVPGGTSGQLTLSCTAQNFQTPDGDTYTPTGTFTATNATTVTAIGATITVTATPQQLGLVKTLVASGFGEPYLNVPVTYSIAPQISGSGLGQQRLQNAVVTDVLPATAKYVTSSSDVNASIGGAGGVLTGADVNGFGGTVTWPAMPTPGGHVFVTLIYPSPPNTGDGNPATTADDVTNNAAITAQPYLRPAAPPVTATTSLTHGFKAPAPAAIAVGKTPQPAVAYQRGASDDAGTTPYGVTVLNTGGTIDTFSVTDHLPCLFTSDWTAATCTAANLGFLSQGFVDVGITTNPRTVVFHTTAGNTFTQTIPGGSQTLSPTVNLPAGEYIMDFTVSGTFNPGEQLTLIILGVINPNLPASAPAGTPYLSAVAQGVAAPNVAVENCLNVAGGDVLATDQSTGNPIPQTFSSTQDCGVLKVVPPVPNWQPHKAVPVSSATPTGQVTFQLSANRLASSGVASSPVFLDLLPANLSYVSGSAALAPSVTTDPNPGWATPTVVATANYNGTGRTLVKISWPPSVTLPGGKAVGVTFNARVAAGTAAGSYTNTMDVADSVYSVDTTSPTYYSAVGPCGSTPNGVADSLDLNGNGDTLDVICPASIAYTVAPAASVTVVKSVKGSADTAFTTSPAVGRTIPGSPAAYNIDVQNTGNYALINMISYDILPFVGDTGTSGALAGSPRGSAWQETLSASVAVPAGTTVQYSQSSNPCRGEVYSAGGTTASAPVGCVNDWTTTVPSPISSVRALRFVISGPVAPGATISFPITVASPTTASGVAWNTVAEAAQRADDNTFLLPTENGKVGLEAAPITITKTVKTGPTDNGDGTQTISYDLTVGNPGTTAVQYTLDDALDVGSGVTVLSATVANTAPGTIATSAAWNGTSSTNVVTNVTIGGGASHTYLVTMTATTTSAVTSTSADCILATAESGTGLTNGVTLTFGTLQTTASACAPVLVGQLKIDKTVDKATANHGDTLTYTVTVANIGGLRATNVAATDLVPAGATYVATAGDGSPAVAGSVSVGQTLTWSIASIAVGSTTTFTVTATTDTSVDAETATNSFGITDPAVFIPHVTVDPCTADATRSCAITILPAAAQPTVRIATVAFTGDDLRTLLVLAAILLGGGLVITRLARRERR